MRDLILAALVLGSIPFILKRPYFGLLMWIWLGIMNPHRLAYGFAYSMPWAQIVALATLIALLVHANKLHRFPLNGITVSMICLVFWVGVSPPFSFHPDGEFYYWIRVIKIQLMVMVAFLVIQTREELHRLALVLALSIGFFGIKGGLFTIATGGTHKVWGPDGSFIEDNNALALAIITGIPLFRYLQLQAQNAWIKRACLGAMVLCTASAIGSYSRGALLALLAMSAFLWMKSRNKGLLGILLVVALPFAFMAMPDAWFERMNTIKTYDEDRSAMGRINAWWVAWNVALDRFPIGAGFNMYTAEVFARYAPDPHAIHAAHSIYFQVLGEHGFIGLGLYLTIFIGAWRAGGWVVRNTKGRDDLTWARDLAAMVQVSLIGFGVGGTFLSLTYFDLPYYLVVLVVVLREHVRKELAKPPDTATVPQAAPPVRAGGPPGRVPT